jgi:hypothetical protein
LIPINAPDGDDRDCPRAGEADQIPASIADYCTRINDSAH